MTAYATAEQSLPDSQLRPIDRIPDTRTGIPHTAGRLDGPRFDGLLARLADLVADRLAERIGSPANQVAEQWMDAREAAEYIGIHRDTLRKLAAERAVPVHQDGPRCKLYFRRDELNEWRRSSRAGRSRLRAVS